MMKTEQERIDELINQRLKEKVRRYRNMDELEWLEYNREQLQKRLKASKKRMKATYQELTQPAVPTSKWGMFNYLLDKGMNIIQGVKIGYKVGDAIKLIMGLRKKKKK